MPKLRDDGLPMTSAGISWTKSTAASAKEKDKRAQFIVNRIRFLLASYRRDNTPNPEGYIGAIGLVLDRYPDGVIADCTDPVTGMVADERWRTFPPTAGEVRAWCDNHSLLRKSAYEQRVERQLREREEMERAHAAIPPEERAAHVRRVEDELANHGIFTAGWKRRQRQAEIERTREAMRAAGQAVPIDAPRRLLSWQEAEELRARRADVLRSEAEARAAAGAAEKAAHALNGAEGGEGGTPSK